MKKDNKISMRVSNSFMKMVTFVSETLGIGKTEAIVFLSSAGYTTFSSTEDVITKYAELRELL